MLELSRLSRCIQVVAGAPAAQWIEAWCVRPMVHTLDALAQALRPRRPTSSAAHLQRNACQAACQKPDTRGALRPAGRPMQLQPMAWEQTTLGAPSPLLAREAGVAQTQKPGVPTTAHGLVPRATFPGEG